MFDAMRLSGPLLTMTMLLVACGDDAPARDAGDTSDEGDTIADVTSGDTVADVTSGDTVADADTVDAMQRWGAPLDPLSPWPKFRRDLAQTGRSEVMPVADEARAPWVFPTGKGIFSTPVIDGDGNIYVGSADRSFYAIDDSGAQRWRFETGEIIDSSALLDDAGRVIFGSGDGHVYALDRDDGDELWRFEADDPATLGSFIRWFEGNVAILPDGTLVAPNDNFCTYALARDTGAKRWCLRTADQTWSLPAVDRATSRLFLGNNFYFGQNVLAVDPATGEPLWTASALGSVAASPVLVGEGDDQKVVVGGFDGFVRAFASDDGAPLWEAPLRDHVYASPALAESGDIIQAGADGTVYALSAADGHVLWAYDIGAPIRSSPAIDGAGNIYVGAGDGRLWVIEPDGELSWSLALVEADRNDLNASPALGPDGVVIAGESGEVFFVPWGFCLRAAEVDNPGCVRGPGETLPEATTELRLTTRFGSVVAGASATIEPNEALTLSLVQRAAGDTVLAVIDVAALEVTTTPARDVSVVVSGDRRFVSLVPEEPWADAAGGEVEVRVTGRSLVAPFVREGLKLSGGEPGPAFDQTFDLDVAARGSAPLALAVPATPGAAHGVWELARLAAPLPTILPSYNQIGFDSVHYLVGLVGESSPGRGWAWAIGALPSGAGAVVDPASRVRFPLVVTREGAMLTLDNQVGFGIDFNGFTLPFARFRVAGTLAASGAGAGAFGVFAQAICGEIDFYGPFLRQLGFCHPDTDILAAAGAVELRVHAISATPPAGVGVVTLSYAPGDDGTIVVSAALAGSSLVAAEHNLGVLVLDGDGAPRRCDYVEGTSVGTDEAGHPTSVAVGCAGDDPPGAAWLMVDVSAVARHDF